METLAATASLQAEVRAARLTVVYDEGGQWQTIPKSSLRKGETKQATLLNGALRSLSMRLGNAGSPLHQRVKDEERESR